MAGETIFRKTISKFDIGGILSLDQHVGFEDGVGLRIDLLSEKLHPCFGIELAHIFLSDGEHPARSSRRIVQGLHDAGSGEIGRASCREREEIVLWEES